MPNHPNRGWRARARAAADAWLDRHPWRVEPGARILTEDELRTAMREAYLAGYEAGRPAPRPAA